MPTTAIRTRGTVKWYDPRKGYGMIARGGAPLVFLHASQVSDEGASTLSAGDEVQFFVVPGPHGSIAQRIRRTTNTEKL